ncbi:MAG: hypothetical protein ABEJ98_05270 [Candidatus Nanohaloarchaea archaeon]
MKSRAGSGEPTQHSPGKNMYSELNNGRSATFVGEEDLGEHGSKMKQTTARFTEDTWELIEKLSEKKDQSFADSIRELTREGIIGARKSKAFLLEVIQNLQNREDEEVKKAAELIEEVIRDSCEPPVFQKGGEVSEE